MPECLKLKCANEDCLGAWMTEKWNCWMENCWNAWMQICELKCLKTNAWNWNAANAWIEMLELRCLNANAWKAWMVKDPNAWMQYDWMQMFDDCWNAMPELNCLNANAWNAWNEIAWLKCLTINIEKIAIIYMA